MTLELKQQEVHNVFNKNVCLNNDGKQLPSIYVEYENDVIDNEVKGK